MKCKQFFFVGIALVLSLVVAGCSNTTQQNSPDSGTRVSQTETQSSEASASRGATSLTVRFGVEGEPFTMSLEDNTTAASIAQYVGSQDWRLPVYSYDESDVMEYYDVPSRYEIPDNSETVTQAHAGDVYYSDPNRIVLYYRDTEINEEYTLIGTFEPTEEFVSAVENNPVQEGWGNQLVLISTGE